MSYRTYINAKVSKLFGLDKADAEAKKPKNTTTSSAPTDQYTKTTKVNGYVELVNGKRRNFEGEQYVLNRMGQGTYLSANRRSNANPAAKPILTVPDLEKEILWVAPANATDVKPFLDRYLALEKMVSYEMIDIKKDLKNKVMSVEDESILKKKYDKYEKLLGKCQSQIELARIYVEQNKADKAYELKKKEEAKKAMK